MPEEPFTAADRAQMSSLGIAPAEVRRQLDLFRDPPPFLHLSRPATVGDGITRLDRERHAELLTRFEEAVLPGEVSKLVPASGAASRMFRDLLAYREGGAGDPPPEAIRRFFTKLDRFAFYGDLATAAERQGESLEALRQEGDHAEILRLLLTPAGLDYDARPKGLILFHRYPEGGRTPFEEHLVEGAAYTRDGNGRCRLHFTVTPEDEGRFRRLLSAVEGPLGERFGARFEVGFSHQSHATDTLAVAPDDRPFRLEDGSLLFRPAGHGSLIGNLARLESDLVFVKNIDNVVPEDRQPTVVEWKKLLAGHLLVVRDRLFELLDRLERGEEEAVPEAERFLGQVLSRPLRPGAAPAASAERRRWLAEHLDRPLRVCGVVENVGEPGGGPFWVEAADGELSLQIVEASQVDPGSESQQTVLAGATHFNPVDLVCSLRDRHGRPYELERYIDPSTVFISTKFHAGRPLKALERPGLWNGAMAGWNTLFVEVPLATFAPVKTVFDLLRPEHQPSPEG